MDPHLEGEKLKVSRTEFKENHMNNKIMICMSEPCISIPLKRR